MIRNRLFIVGLLLSVLLVTSYGAFRLMTHYVLEQRGPAVDTQYLYIKPGSGLAQVARAASLAGLVHEPWHLSLGARALGFGRSIKAGEYEIKPATSVRELLTILQEGKTYLRRISVAEGVSSLELEQVLNSSFGLDMTHFSLPAEGSVLPETYFYSRGESANAVVARMKAAMTVTLAAAWTTRVKGLPLKNDYQAVVLASIVEKETAVSYERAQVAAVFLNRLKRGMRLQSDPSVIYGITAGLSLGRPLSKGDLNTETAFNTYRIDGLPPTPISNPGKASIEAVLNPADVPYLYFVADGKGGHAFATTLKAHNANVRAWRQGRAAITTKQ